MATVTTFNLSLTLVACAVAGLAASSPTPRPASSLGRTAMHQDADGKKLYLKNCRQCHSTSGEPDAESKAKYPKIKSLNDAAFLAKLSDDSIAKVIKNGAGKDMKSFGDRLNAEEIAAVVKYVRTLPSKPAK